MEAFLEADMSALEAFKTVNKEKALDPIEVKAKNFVTANSNIVNLPAASSSQPLGSVYELKKNVFDEIYRSFYQNLQKVVGGRYVIFVKVPVNEFVRIEREKTGEKVLRGKWISMLVCKSSDLSVVCGIQLRGAGMEFEREFGFLKDLFRQIEKPLLDFPLVRDISRAEILEQWQTLVLASNQARNCPKCGNQMTMRKAVKGKNAGRSFWVCTRFPSCNGITRIGRFN